MFNFDVTICLKNTGFTSLHFTSEVSKQARKSCGTKHEILDSGKATTQHALHVMVSIQGLLSFFFL